MNQHRTNTHRSSRAIALLPVLLVGGMSCSGTPLQGQPDCTGLAVPTIACLVGPTVQTCARDANGRPGWVITCPGENDAGSDGGGLGNPCASTGSCASGQICTTEDGVCNAPHGCGGNAGACPAVCYGTCRAAQVPAPLTFQLENGGATSVYLFESCVPDLTITSLANPPHAIGLPGGGCGICECTAQTCPQVVCGACYQGGLEVAAGRAQSYFWVPADVAYETRATSSCSRTQALPAGHYRIDIPVYANSGDAAAKTAARTVSQTFDLPAATDVITVPLAASP